VEVSEYARRELAVKIQRFSNLGDDSKIEKVIEALQRLIGWAGAVSATLGENFPSKEEIYDQVIEALRFDFDTDALVAVLDGGWDAGQMQPVNLARLKAQADTAWRQALLRNPVTGLIDTGIANLTSIFRNDPAWAGCLGYDTLLKKVTIERPLPLALDASTLDEIAPETSVVKDSLTQAPDFVLPAVISHPTAFGLMSSWFSEAWQLSVNSKNALIQAAQTAAMFQRSNRALEWAKKQVWGGELRLIPPHYGQKDAPEEPSRLALCFTDDIEYATRVVTPFLRIFVLSFVARLLKPGCKVDTLLVLEGPQGFRKSTSMALLVPHKIYFSDSPLELGDKEGLQAGSSILMREISELDKLLWRKNAAELKGWARSSTDHYRAPYDTEFRMYARTFVTYCTVNAEGAWLNDSGKQRGYMPITVHRNIDTDYIAEFRGQIIAEAIALLAAGWSYFPNAEETLLINEEMNTRLVPNALTEVIREDLYRYGLTFVQTMDVAQVLLDVTKERIDSKVSANISTAMTALGWSQGREWRGPSRLVGWKAPTTWRPAPTGWDSVAAPRKGQFARPVGTSPEKSQWADDSKENIVQFDSLRKKGGI